MKRVKPNIAELLLGAIVTAVFFLALVYFVVANSTK